MMISRSTIDAIGHLDEASFPVGYGEENDFCIRARAAGFSIHVADDVFVYHAKSKSFGRARREKLARDGSAALKKKHGDDAVRSLSEGMANATELALLRERLLRERWETLARHTTTDPMSIAVLFLLPVKGGSGGANSVIQEAMGMRRLGGRVNVAVRSSDLDRMRRLYADVDGISDLLVPADESTLLDIARGFDVVVATLFKSVRDLARIVAAYPECLPAYYVQDYEPYFFEADSAQWRQARTSYERIANAHLFAKTRWIAEEVHRLHGIPVHKVEPSIDHDVYRPAPRALDGIVRVTAMVRPQTPRRAAARTMRVLRAVEARHPERVAIHVFGCDPSDPRFQALERDFPFVSYGTLSRPEVASLLRQSDVFVDLSDYQAFGRTGLEAMASGCVAVVPKRGGTDEYAVDGENAVVVDTDDEELCVERISRLVDSPADLLRLRSRGLETAARYSIHRAAMSELLLLARGVAAHRAAQTTSIVRRSAYSLPAVHQNQSLSAQGVERLVGPWRALPVRRSWNHTITSSTELDSLTNPGVMMVQLGSDVGDPSAFCDWLGSWRSKGGRLVVDLCEPIFEPELSPSRQCDHTNWVARLADAVLVESPERVAHAQEVNRNVFVAPTILDPQLWGPRDEPPADGRLRIGYLGDPRRPDQIVHLARAIGDLEERMGDRLVVESIGAFQDAECRLGKRVGLPRRRDYGSYVGWLRRRATWDFVVVPRPLEPHPGSEVRLLQLATLGLPVICAEGHPGSSWVAREGLGRVVDDSVHGWRDGLALFSSDPSLRRSMASLAVDAATRRRVEAEQEWLSWLETLEQAPRRVDVPVRVGRRPRWLDAMVQIPEAPSVVGMTRPRSAFVASASPETSKSRRKLEKLMREPERFFADSKSPLLRAVGNVVKKIPRSV